MAELTAHAQLADRSRSFFQWMAGLCVLYAFGGFTPTYFMPIGAGTLREVSPAVHVHGFLFFTWTLVFLLQASLVAKGRVALHRSIGMVGISLATAMVIFGLIVNLQFSAAALAGERPIDEARAYALFFGGNMSMLGFGTLFALAIAYLKRPDVHKRLMVFATCMILTAAVSRMWGPLFPDGVPTLLTYATIDVILVACLIHDWRTLGRIHTATIGGGGALLLAQLLRSTAGETDLWRETATVLVRLTG